MRLESTLVKVFLKILFSPQKKKLVIPSRSLVEKGIRTCSDLLLQTCFVNDLVLSVETIFVSNSLKLSVPVEKNAGVKWFICSH